MYAAYQRGLPVVAIVRVSLKKGISVAIYPFCLSYGKDTFTECIMPNHTSKRYNSGVCKNIIFLLS